MNWNAIKKSAGGTAAGRRLAILLSICMLGATALFAGGVSKDLQPVLPLNPLARVDVIIQFNHVPSGGVLQAISRAGGLQKLAFPMLNGGLFTVPAAALKGLAESPEIAYISPDRSVSGTLEFAEP